MRKTEPRDEADCLTRRDSRKEKNYRQYTISYLDYLKHPVYRGVYFVLYPYLVVREVGFRHCCAGV